MGLRAGLSQTSSAQFKKFEELNHLLLHFGSWGLGGEGGGGGSLGEEGGDSGGSEEVEATLGGAAPQSVGVEGEQVEPVGGALHLLDGAQHLPLHPHHRSLHFALPAHLHLGAPA